MGKNVYSISIVLIVLFCMFIGNLIVKEDMKNIDDIVELSDLGIVWSHINIDGWAKLEGNTVANFQDGAYIILEDVVYMPSWAKWRESIRRMEEDFRERRGCPTISSTLVGYCDKKIDREEVWKLCMTILNRAKAEQIDIMEDGKLISMTGHTSLIEDSYRTLKGEVNINVAARYNSFEDRTYVFIGTPIINIEY